MKNNKTPYLCVVFLLMTHFMYAQTIFRAGYVIDLKHDTLIGEIDYRGDVWMGEKCVFKAQNTGNITEYKPNDIVAYRFKDDRFFVAKEIEGKKVFLEFLIKGKINIYYWRNSSKEYYFVEKESGQLEELPYKEETIYGTLENPSTMYLSQTNAHKNILRRYMKDVPKFKSRIDKLKKPEHDNLIELARDYHRQVCKDEACIVYKKKKPPLNVSVEVVGGVLKYSGLVEVAQDNYTNLGVLAHFWLPRVNEKLYFRTGVIYSKINALDVFSRSGRDITAVNLYKIPIQIEYIYPKGTIRPIFAYGLNFYKPFYVNVGFMGGVNVKLSKKVALCFNYDVDFTPFEFLPILPTHFFSHSALMGLKVKL